jgi:hypothetical protein
LLLAFFGAATQAAGCEANDRFSESLEFSTRAFVGTVAGYRLDDTSLATLAPECRFGYDDARLSAECVAYWKHVVSIQYSVEIAISGIDANRAYETAISNPDGCVPRIGERWLTSGWHRDGFSMKLDTMPSDEQIAEWRAIAAGNDRP